VVYRQQHQLQLIAGLGPMNRDKHHLIYIQRLSVKEFAFFYIWIIWQWQWFLSFLFTLLWPKGRIAEQSCVRAVLKQFNVAHCTIQNKLKHKNINRTKITAGW